MECLCGAWSLGRVCALVSGVVKVFGPQVGNKRTHPTGFWDKLGSQRAPLQPQSRTCAQPARGASGVKPHLTPEPGGLALEGGAGDGRPSSEGTHSPLLRFCVLLGPQHIGGCPWPWGALLYSVPRLQRRSLLDMRRTCPFYQWSGQLR